MIIAWDWNRNAAVGHCPTHVQKDERARLHANHELSEQHQPGTESASPRIRQDSGGFPLCGWNLGMESVVLVSLAPSNPKTGKPCRPASLPPPDPGPDDDDAEPPQDKLRSKGKIQPPGTVSGPPQA